jgi:hypothetical protein
MRASPPIQVSLTRFAGWRCGVLALAGIAAAVPLAWLAALPLLPASAWIGAAVGLAAMAACFGLQLAHTPTRSLRWDGQRWHVGPLASAGDEPWHGELAVALDLGGWMLLRFVAAEAPARRCVVWIPAEKRGLEACWHALRCAVYSPRPAAGGVDSATA